MAPKGSFELNCVSCKKPICFSLLDLEENKLVECSECGKKYGFSGEPLSRQLQKFATLCRAIQDSEEILGNGGVAVSVGGEEVLIPYKILLTRLKSTLDLAVGGEKMLINFRIEPTAL
jgi:hypothetical protein